MTAAPRLVERRPIAGASAVLLPMDPSGRPDWSAFETHLGRTLAAGLTPAVNMDTGFGPYLDAGDRAEVLRITAASTADFIAGVHVDDQPGDSLDLPRLLAEASGVAASGAVPIVFPSHGTATLGDDELVEVHRRVAGVVDRMLGFELGPMFHPAGRIYSTPVFEALLGIDAIVGLKHSSLRRDVEWERLASRDRLRPDFRLMTGNDLAIDMVIYGCDYLLGLSTFAPDAFAARDAAWASGETARFWELNDVLQYLGQFAFRPPVPAYRHDAALFLEARGWLTTGCTHPRSPARPDSDRAVLVDLAERIDRLVGS